MSTESQKRQQECAQHPAIVEISHYVHSARDVTYNEKVVADEHEVSTLRVRLSPNNPPLTLVRANNLAADLLDLLRSLGCRSLGCSVATEDVDHGPAAINIHADHSRAEEIRDVVKAIRLKKSSSVAPA